MSAEDYVLKKNKGEDSLWPVYEKNSHGFVEELRTERGTIEEIMTRPFDQLESLVDMIGDDMYHHFGFVAETVIADGKRRIKKACQLLTDKVGEICFDTPQRDAYIYDRLPCWVHVWPEEEPKEEQRRSRYDKSHPGHGSKAEGNQQVAYLGTIIERINEAADNKTVEAFDEICLDAAKVVEEQRKVVTVNELEEQLKPLKRKLDLEIQWYTYHLKDARNKARRLKNPINRNGKPLKESTLKTYRSIVANWPEKQEAFKKDIKAMSNKLKSMSNHKGKTITRGNVSLRLIYGGEYPAKYEREFDQGWQAIR